MEPQQNCPPTQLDTQISQGLAPQYHRAARSGKKIACPLQAWQSSHNTRQSRTSITGETQILWYMFEVMCMILFHHYFSYRTLSASMPTLTHRPCTDSGMPGGPHTSTSTSSGPPSHSTEEVNTWSLMRPWNTSQWPPFSCLALVLPKRQRQIYCCRCQWRRKARARNLDVTRPIVESRDGTRAHPHFLLNIFLNSLNRRVCLSSWPSSYKLS